MKSIPEIVRAIDSIVTEVELSREFCKEKQNPKDINIVLGQLRAAKLSLIKAFKAANKETV